MMRFIFRLSPFRVKNDAYYTTNARCPLLLPSPIYLCYSIQCARWPDAERKDNMDTNKTPREGRAVLKKVRLTAMERLAIETGLDAGKTLYAIAQ